jgi:HD superfamily phosphohydrolase
VIFARATVKNQWLAIETMLLCTWRMFNYLYQNHVVSTMQKYILSRVVTPNKSFELLSLISHFRIYLLLPKERVQCLNYMPNSWILAGAEPGFSIEVGEPTAKPDFF